MGELSQDLRQAWGQEYNPALLLMFSKCKSASLPELQIIRTGRLPALVPYLHLSVPLSHT